MIVRADWIHVAFPLATSAAATLLWWELNVVEQRYRAVLAVLDRASARWRRFRRG